MTFSRLQKAFKQLQLKPMNSSSANANVWISAGIFCNMSYPIRRNDINKGARNCQLRNLQELSFHFSQPAKIKTKTQRNFSNINEMKESTILLYKYQLERFCIGDEE